MIRPIFEEDDEKKKGFEEIIKFGNKFGRYLSKMSILTHVMKEDKCLK